MLLNIITYDNNTPYLSKNLSYRQNYELTLIDTVKAPFAHELLDRIEEIVDPADIDYLISNHVEMDHSGSITAVMEAAPKAVLVTSSPNGIKELKAHYGDNYNFMELKVGDTISLGKRSLSFIGTPMLHWPDNMATYCSEEKILFSNDAFGQHFTSGKHFDDEVELAQVLNDTQGYYANILMTFGAQARKALEVVEGLAIEMIAPSHGVIWRSHVKDVLNLSYLKGLQPKNKKGFAFGSYGWGGQSIGIVNQAL